PSQRRRFDPTAGGLCWCFRLCRGSCLRSRLGSVLLRGLSLGRVLRFCCVRFRWLGRLGLGLGFLVTLWRLWGGTAAVDILAGLTDPPDEIGNRYRAPGCDDLLEQDAGTAGHQLHDSLVGLDFCQYVPGGDLVALVLLPLDQAPFLHRGRERLHHDLGGHQRYSTFLAASWILAASTFAARSRNLL